MSKLDGASSTGQRLAKGGSPVAAVAYSVEEAQTVVADLVAEARRAFEDGRFAVLPTERTIPAMYAAAALAHCCHLAEHLIDAHGHGHELAARLTTRALYESWVIGLYIHYGGTGALEALQADYHHQVKTQADHAKRHDTQVPKRRADTDRRNVKIDAANAGIRTWNDTNPGLPPKPLLERVPEPPGVILDYSEWEERLETLRDTSPQALPLPTIIDRLRSLTKDAGDEESFEASYVMFFRGLSTVGAHTNIQVLSYYLDDNSGRGTFTRVSPHARPPSSLEEANLLTAILLVAHLSQRVLGQRGCEHPVADRVYQRFVEIQASATDHEPA